MQHDDPQHVNRPQWHQINIQFDGHDTSERNAIAHLGPTLMTAEYTGLLTSWFFIRKQWWRFRYMPTSGTSAGEAKRRLIGEAIENFTSHRFPRSATGTIINPAG